MTKLHSIIFFLIVGMSTIPFLSSNIYAQDDNTTPTTEETKPILFVLDTCPYCNALLKELEENDLVDTVEIKEVSQEPEKSIFAAVISTCGIKTAVPTLYIDEKCFQGQYTARDRIFQANFIPLPDEIVIEDETSTNIISDDTIEIQETTESNDIVEKRSLEESIANTDGNSPQEKKIVNFNSNSGDYNWLTAIAALLAPMVLILIAYLIIVKMKV